MPSLEKRKLLETSYAPVVTKTYSRSVETTTQEKVEGGEKAIHVLSLLRRCSRHNNPAPVTIVRVLQKAFSHALEVYECPELAAKRKRRRLRAKVTWMAGCASAIRYPRKCCRRSATGCSWTAEREG